MTWGVWSTRASDFVVTGELCQAGADHERACLLEAGIAEWAEELIVREEMIDAPVCELCDEPTHDKDSHGTLICEDCQDDDTDSLDGLWCAECGTAEAMAWVVSFDGDDRTEVCRTCDDALREVTA